MTTKNKPVIKFSATVASVKTLVDGGLRITLDLPEDAIAQAASLMACKREGIPLTVEVKADTGGAV
jgi:hypothetical protein